MGFVTEILHTRNREAAVRALVERYDRVLVRNKNNLWNPLRLRRAQLQDLKPFIVLNPQEFDTELAGWNERGGVLLYDRAYVALENIGAHPAQLISECPLSLQQLDSYIEGTSELAVVYRPPNWNEHRRWIRSNVPSAERCQRLWELVGAAPERPDIAGPLGFCTKGCRVVSERDAQVHLGARSAELQCVRRAFLLPRAFKAVWRVVPRIAPDDPTLVDVYDFIDKRCPTVDGARLVVPGIISRHTRHWKVAIRQLERRGAVSLPGALFCYYLGDVTPHWERLDARQRVAERRLEEIIAKIEASPEFNPKRAPPSPRLPAHPARSRSLSAA
jgi:hypothetical protein